MVHRVTAAIATGKHPDPSRTRKLSLPAPMVLQPRGCGRVGRRRTNIARGPPFRGWPFGHFRRLSRPIRRARSRPQATGLRGFVHRGRPATTVAVGSAARALAGGGDVHVSTDDRRRRRGAAAEARSPSTRCGWPGGSRPAPEERVLPSGDIALDVPGGGAPAAGGRAGVASQRRRARVRGVGRPGAPLGRQRGATATWSR